MFCETEFEMVGLRPDVMSVARKTFGDWDFAGLALIFGPTFLRFTFVTVKFIWRGFEPVKPPKYAHGLCTLQIIKYGSIIYFYRFYWHGTHDPYNLKYPFH